MDVIRATYPGFTIRKYLAAMSLAPPAMERLVVQLRELGVPEE